MPFTSVRDVRRARHTCQSCQDRKARFSYRGVVKADRDHTLCFECFRRERERQRAKLLAEAPSAAPLRVPVPSWAQQRLSDRQVEHRRVMLANLGQRR